MHRALRWGAGVMWGGALTIASGSAISPTWAHSRALGQAQRMIIAAAATLTVAALVHRGQASLETAYELGELSGMNKRRPIQDQSNALEATARRANR